MNILLELYYGNINPTAKCFDRNSEFASLTNIISENEKKLSDYLGGEEKHLFSQLMNAQREILFASEQERFLEGFQMGARFVLDTFLIPPQGELKDIC